MEKFQHWTRGFREWLGHDLPRDYLVFDIETSGFGPQDLVVDFGFVRVDDTQVVDSENWFFNWYDYPGIETEWLDRRLAAARQQMEDGGRTYIYDEALLRASGDDPFELTRRLLRLFQDTREERRIFVGHGAYAFDNRMLKQLLWEMLQTDWNFGSNELFDTGLMEKSIAGGYAPQPSDVSLFTFFDRIRRVYNKGLKWNVDLCVEKYGLDCSSLIKSGGQRHTALFDALVTQQIFEAHRSMVYADYQV